jgi:hypothetical protein
MTEPNKKASPKTPIDELIDFLVSGNHYLHLDQSDYEERMKKELKGLKRKQ